MIGRDNEFTLCFKGITDWKGPSSPSVMADKPQRSEEASEHERFALALGKIEQYKILESLYQKVCEERGDLEKKLSDLEKSRNKDSSGARSGMRRSFSITQQILDASTAQPLEHPTELYQVMEREKNQEIEVLMKKSENAQRALKQVQRQRDELHGQIQQLTSEMIEKDGRMKELEQRFQETLTEEQRLSHLEKEQMLRELVHKGAASWVVVNPWKPHLETLTLEKQDDATHGTVELRRKIDELQGRITELLNHNEKWNLLCQELQEELDRVKGQLLQYQKAEGSVKHSLLEDLKFETKRRKDAEKMSLKAQKQVEELEAKVVQLEKQLEEKERQERQMFMEAEELREKALLYEEQLRNYKDDFENEQRDHKITRGQLDSLKNQWLTIYKDLQEKNQQLTAMKQQMEVIEHNNDELQQQLDRARRDKQMIRDHQKQQEERTRTPSIEDLFWECQRCTYRNQETAIVCEMCASARHHALLSGPSSSRGHTSNTTNTTGGQRSISDTRPFGRPSPRIGELEEDGIACY